MQDVAPWIVASEHYRRQLCGQSSVGPADTKVYAFTEAIRPPPVMPLQHTVLATHDQPSGGIDIGGSIAPHDIFGIAVLGDRVTRGDESTARMHEAHALLQRMVHERRRIYGVTTGYGPLASHPVTPEHAEELQRNLL